MSTSQQPDPRDRPARLTVGVVGAGRVGPALAASL
ncbi:oxidoreductase, partial [Streptomyces nigra]